MSPAWKLSQGVSSLGDPGARAGYCDSKQKPDSRGGRPRWTREPWGGGSREGEGGSTPAPCWGGGLVPTPKPFLHFCSFALSAEIQRQEYLERPQANNSNNNNNTPAQDFRAGLVPSSRADWTAQRRNLEWNERELRPGAI